VITLFRKLRVRRLSLRSVFSLSLPLVVFVVAGCAATTGETKVASAPKRFNDLPMCREQNSELKMSKQNAGAFSSYYIKKVVVAKLTLNQVICDIGQPHESQVANQPRKFWDMELNAGDQFTRWGRPLTGDPVDDISLMLVTNSAGEVTSIRRSYPFKGELVIVVAGSSGVNVSTGTYPEVPN